MTVSREEMDQYLADLRAYELRLAEWLALNPEQVFKLEERPATRDKLLEVAWWATEVQTPRNCRALPYSVSQRDGEPPVFVGTLVFPYDDERVMREVVGERPVMPGIAEAEWLFGDSPRLQWDWVTAPGVWVFELLDDQGDVVETVTVTEPHGSLTFTSLEPGRMYRIRRTWKPESPAPVVTTTTVERRDTLTLPEFLRACLDEDEGERLHTDDCRLLNSVEGWCDCPGPARALAQVAAHRQIIAELEAWAADGFPNDALSRAVLGALGTAYADRPGYRQEWSDG